MPRRLPVASLFGVGFRKLNLQVNHLDSLNVDSIQVFWIEPVSLACRDVSTHDRVYSLFLFLGNLFTSFNVSLDIFTITSSSFPECSKLIYFFNSY